MARAFVPKDTLQDAWNLILWACEDCNHEKSQLEDAVSAVSMHLPPQSRRGEDDRPLHLEARRKSIGGFGPRADRQRQTFSIGRQLQPGVNLKFELVGPPTVPVEFVTALAHRHMAAFFYMTTFDHETRRGKFWPGEFHMVDWVARSDWGNVRQKAFMERVRGWKPLLVGETARGHFKVALRRDETVGPFWSWALEWNTNYRAIGFVGDAVLVQSRAAELPTPPTFVIATSDDGELHAREDQPLADAARTHPTQRGGRISHP